MTGWIIFVALIAFNVRILYRIHQRGRLIKRRFSIINRRNEILRNTSTPYAERRKLWDETETEFVETEQLRVKLDGLLW